MTNKQKSADEVMEQSSVRYSGLSNKRGVCGSCNEAHEYKELDFQAGFQEGLAYGRDEAKDLVSAIYEAMWRIADLQYGDAYEALSEALEAYKEKVGGK